MNGGVRGIKASELVKKLRQVIKEHGDLEVYHGGGDYPDGVESVHYVPKDKGDGYVPGNTFEIW